MGLDFLYPTKMAKIKRKLLQRQIVQRIPLYGPKIRFVASMYFGVSHENRLHIGKIKKIKKK